MHAVLAVGLESLARNTCKWQQQTSNNISSRAKALQLVLSKHDQTCMRVL
jgi:hypothetical protein